jgi:hypothetical protein
MSKQHAASALLIPLLKRRSAPQNMALIWDKNGGDGGI